MLTLSNQVLITANLRITNRLDRKLVKHPVLLDPLSEKLSSDMRTLTVVDWMALYLTESDEPNDVTAVCLSQKSTRISLIIATIDPVSIDKKTVKVHELFNLTDALAQARQLTFLQKMEIIDKSLAKNCWPKIWSRISALQAVLRRGISESVLQNSSNGLGRVDELIGAWKAHRDSQGLPVDTSKDILEYCRTSQKSLEEAIQHFLKYLLELKNPSTTSPTVLQDRAKCLANALSVSQRLDQANFFLCSAGKGEDYTWTKSLNTKDSLLLRDLYRSLQAVYEYNLGSQMFALDGVKFIQDVIGSTTVPVADSFDVVWVAKQHTYKHPQVHWPAMSPTDYINRMMQRLTHRIPLLDTNRQAVEQEWSQLWSPGAAIAGLKVHAEMQMATYLLQHNVPIIHEAIGISEPPCPACGQYLHGLKWTSRDQSEKVVDDWLAPMEGIVDVGGKHDRLLRSVKNFTVGLAENVVEAFLVDKQYPSRVGPIWKARYSAKHLPSTCGVDVPMTSDTYLERYL